MTKVIISIGLYKELGNMTNTIEKKQDLRKKLLDACIAKQQFLIDDFKERIRSLTEPGGLGNEEAYDNTDVVANTVKALEINTLSNELQFAQEELALLESMKSKQDIERSQVALGAIVVTNHGTFFISASVEKFTAAGHTYVGISTSSPIFQVMQGKQSGDQFTFKGMTYKIKDIL